MTTFCFEGRFLAKYTIYCGGEYRNRTGVHGFAIRCVTTPPTRLCGEGSVKRFTSQRQA